MAPVFRMGLTGVPGSETGSGVPGKSTSDDRPLGEGGVPGLRWPVVCEVWLSGLPQPARTDGPISSSVGGKTGTRVNLSLIHI